MTVIETPVFTRRITEILSDDEYRALQSELIKNPNVGTVIPGSGGLRKVRWSVGGKGKRGGVRIIYYRIVSLETILMLFVFRKNERSDVTKEQLKILARIVKEELP